MRNATHHFSVYSYWNIKFCHRANSTDEHWNSVHLQRPNTDDHASCGFHTRICRRPRHEWARNGRHTRIIRVPFRGSLGGSTRSWQGGEMSRRLFFLFKQAKPVVRVGARPNRREKQKKGVPHEYHHHSDQFGVENQLTLTITSVQLLHPMTLGVQGIETLIRRIAMFGG